MKDNIDKMFEKIHNDVLKRFFPETWNINDSEYHIEVKFTDKNWNNGKTWYFKNRITTPMNNDMIGIREIQENFRNNNGRVVSVATDELIDSLKS